MILIKKNIEINQAATFDLTLELLDSNSEPLNVTGYTGTASLRKHEESANSISFSAGLANGVFNLSLTANASANITPGRYLWDSKIQVGNTVIRVYEGIATVTPAITR